MSRLARPEQPSVRATRFELLRPLGEGSLGVVYEAHDRVRDARVALKKLRRKDPEAITRLKREFRALEHLQHPNLVTLHELFEEEGEWFFTMEIVEGVDFFQYVRGCAADDDPAEGALDEERLRQALAQLVSALVALHGAGKIHRDVKPSNVLVTSSGRVVLLDFGLVTDVDKEPDWTSVNAVGTVRYMAPEQGAGRPVGPEADWYAVGSMLYEALTGCPPFVGSAIHILLDKQRRVPVAPNVVVPGVPEDLSALCMDLLRIEPSRRPAGSSVLERLRSTAVPPSAQFVSLPPENDGAPTSTTTLSKGAGLFLGREPELAFLERALADVRRGEQHSVYVHGESGIGKTELIRAFASRCAASNVIHLHGRCYERETVAYKAVDGVMEDLAKFMRRMHQVEAARLIPRRAGVLLRVFPALTRVAVLASSHDYQVADPQELRVQLFEAFRELFTRMCERHTVVITVDDLQWSDGESLALLSELLRKPGAPPLLFVASWRTGEPTGSGLDALPGEARKLELGRLSRDSARELAQNLLALGGGDLARADQVAEAAGGHPILIDELARFTALGRPERTSLHVEDALWARIEKLDSEVRAVLELYAIASAPLAPAVVARAARLNPAELSRHIAALRVLRLLRTSATRTNPTTELYHDSVRRAVLAHIDPGAQRAAHAALARALRASGQEEWELLALHHQGAGEDEQAAQCLLRGAEQGEHALAFGHAARLYERVLSVWSEEHPERRAVQIKRGDALANAGRGLEAARAYAVAATSADAVQGLDLTRRAAQQLLLAGHVDEGLAQLERVLASESISLPRTPFRALWSIIVQRVLLSLRGLRFARLDPSQVSPRTHSRADLCWRAGMALTMTDHLRGQSLCLRAVFEALRTGNAYLASRAFSLYAGHCASAGSAAEERVDAILDRANALAAEADSAHALAVVQAIRGQARYLCGRFRPAVQYLTEAEQLLREQCVGVPFELDTVRMFSMRALLHLGEYAEVNDRLPAMLEECRQRDDLYGEVSLRSLVQAIALLALDRPDEALADIAGTEELWTTRGYHAQHLYFAQSKASIELYAGRYAEAVAAALRARADMQRSQLRRVQGLRITTHALCGRALLASFTEGKPADLRAVEELAWLLERERVAWATPQAQLLRAAVARLRGRLDECVVALRAALGGFEAVEMRALAACTSIRLGRVLAGAEGQNLESRGMAALADQRIAAPERMLALLAPGFRS
jgi:hypothetical protein